MPTKYLDEEGLSHVVRRAKETFAEKKELWNWQKTEKAGAVAFTPVPDSVLEPVVEFKFKETLPAEGEKGPDNPSTIEGVDSINVFQCGKNLYHFQGNKEVNGITFTDNGDGSITIDGTASDVATYRILPSPEYLYWCRNGITYAITGGVYPIAVAQYNDVGYNYGGHVLTYTSNEDKASASDIVVQSGISVSNLTVWPQMEIGSSATSFEKGTIVKSTISFDNTYYGGILDINTGLLTVTYASKTFDGTEPWSITSPGTNVATFFNTGDIYPGKAVDQVDAYCEYFPRISNSEADEIGFGLFTSNPGGYFKYPDSSMTVSDFQSWLAEKYNAGNPVTIVYKLAEPITVQLDPIQIKSLASLDKYEPRINTIYTDAESIQVGYQKFAASEKGINGISLRETSSTVRNEIHPVNPIEWDMAYDLYNGSYCLHGDIDFYDASGNEITLSTGYTVSEPDTQSVTINFPNAVPKTIDGYIAICQGNCDGWSSISFDNVSIEDILNAGVDGLFIQGGFLFSNWGGPYPYPNDTDAVVYMTDNGNGSYTMKFATCTSSEATYPECHIENADGTNESLNLDILYNHVGGQIIDDMNTYLPLWVDQSETPTLPIFDLYDMMSFGFRDSSNNNIPFDSYSYASDGKSVIVDFGNNPFPTKLASMVSYFTEESLSNEHVESMYVIGIETTSMGWWDAVSISLDEAFGMSNGILLHEYSYYDDPPVLLSNNTISLLVERVSETAIKLSIVQPNENGSIKLHLESAFTNDIDLAPLARKTVSSVSLKTQVLQPQMHSNDDADSYNISIEFYDGNGVYLNRDYLNNNNFTCDNIQTQIDPSAKYIKIVYMEYYSGHLCVDYRTDFIKISDLKKGKFLPSNEANRYYAI